MNKQIFNDKEITILLYILTNKKQEYKKLLDNPLNGNLLNENIKISILQIDTIIKKIKNPNYKSKIEVL